MPDIAKYQDRLNQAAEKYLDDTSNPFDLYPATGERALGIATYCAAHEVADEMSKRELTDFLGISEYESELDGKGVQYMRNIIAAVLRKHVSFSEEVRARSI